MSSPKIEWFEIPVLDMTRAVVFYEAIFDIKIQVQDFNGTLMGWFPDADELSSGASGALIYNEIHYKPADIGVLVYFSSDDIEKVLKKIEIAGGVVLQPKTLISDEIGYMALFLDSEGNKLALYSKE